MGASAEIKAAGNELWRAKVMGEIDDEPQQLYEYAQDLVIYHLGIEEDEIPEGLCSFSMAVGAALFWTGHLVSLHQPQFPAEEE